MVLDELTPEEAAEHDHRRVENIDHVGERPREALLVARKRRRACGVPAQGATGDLVYPRRGWTDLSSETVSIPRTGASALAANLVQVRRGDQRVVILYWYQLPGGTIGSDHLYRARLIWNRIVHRRADGALVRVAAPVPPDGSPAQVIAQQAEFLEAFLPELSRSLPR